MRAIDALIGAACVFVANAAFAANSTSTQSYRLRGTGSLAQDAQVQSSDRFRLKADLGAQLPGPNPAPLVQAGGGFTLSAVAAPDSLVCYNDTIFRDGFDGTGL